MGSRAQKLIRAIFGLPSGRVPPNYRGFASYGGRSLLTDRIFAEQGSANGSGGPAGPACCSSSPAISAPVGVCSSNGKRSIAPGYDYQTPISWGLKSGDGDTSPNQPLYKSVYPPGGNYGQIADIPTGPDVEWILINEPAVFVDKLITLSKPANTIFIASRRELDQAMGIFISFQKTNMAIGGTLLGDEIVFELVHKAIKGSNANTVLAQPYIRFCNPITQFYLSHPTTGGAGNIKFVLGATSDIQEFGSNA